VVVVDDQAMAITHVVRGEDHLSNTPKHIALLRALGYREPRFGHIPLILNPDRSKMSKRKSQTAITDYREQGYLPEAMVNFLAFLGWSPGTGEELFDLDGLVRAFELEKVQSSPAVFDQAKLDSVNGLHIRALSPAEFAERLAPFVPDLSPDLRAAAAPLVQERMQRLAEAPALLSFLVHRPEVLPDEIVPRSKDLDGTISVLQDLRTLFETEEPAESMEPSLRALGERHGWKASELFMTLRIALTGSTVTPPLLPSAKLLGRNECLVRIDHAIGQLIGRRQ
jgi:glutamyl-tRNA synthetase